MTSAPTRLGTDRTADDWQRLIVLHNPKVLVALLARGVRLQQAREICHETWARLFEQFRLGRLGTVELPGLAIAQAAFLLTMDARASRARQCERPLHLEPAVIGLADPCATAEEWVAARQLLARAESVLSGCSERSRSIFLAAYRNPDTSHRELAVRFNVSVQRFRQSLCEVRSKLRRTLEEATRE